LEAITSLIGDWKVLSSTADAAISQLRARRASVCSHTRWRQGTFWRDSQLRFFWECIDCSTQQRARAEQPIGRLFSWRGRQLHAPLSPQRVPRDIQVSAAIAPAPVFLPPSPAPSFAATDALTSSALSQAFEILLFADEASVESWMGPVDQPAAELLDSASPPPPLGSPIPSVAADSAGSGSFLVSAAASPAATVPGDVSPLPAAAAWEAVWALIGENREEEEPLADLADGHQNLSHDVAEAHVAAVPDSPVAPALSSPLSSFDSSPSGVPEAPPLEHSQDISWDGFGWAGVPW
jgi:hypothetical protein